MAALALAACLGLSTAYAATKTPQASSAQATPPAAASPVLPGSEPFRVVALITSDGRSEGVSLCFSPALDHAAATAIVKHMAALGGWQAHDLKVTDDTFISAWDEETQKHPTGERLTYVDFAAEGVINKSERWIPLNPLIVALKDFSPMRLALRLGDQVFVDGPGDYADNTVEIKCSRQPNTVSYDIVVRDPTLTGTSVPAHPPAPLARSAPPPATPRSGSPWLIVVIGALAMVAIAGLALAVWWKGLRPQAAKRGGIKPGVSAPEPTQKSG